MVAGARTLTLEETFLDPQIIEPPPTRHALFILLLALTAMLQLGPANWGDLYDGLEGQFAGGAREMLNSHQWLVPTIDGVPCLETPPLAYWLIAFSYKKHQETCARTIICWWYFSNVPCNKTSFKSQSIDPSIF